MPIANYHHLDQMIGAVNTLRPDEISRLVADNVDESCRVLIRRHIKPDFDALTDESQHACKDSLRYFLSTNGAPFDDILSSQQELHIEPSRDARDFFLWLWEELFPGEDYSLSDRADWVIDNDVARAQVRYK